MVGSAIDKLLLPLNLLQSQLRLASRHILLIPQTLQVSLSILLNRRECLLLSADAQRRQQFHLFILEDFVCPLLHLLKLSVFSLHLQLLFYLICLVLYLL